MHVNLWCISKKNKTIASHTFLLLLYFCCRVGEGRSVDLRNLHPCTIINKYRMAKGFFTAILSYFSTSSSKQRIAASFNLGKTLSPATMEVEQVLRMNGGLGDVSYASNSSLQVCV